MHLIRNSMDHGLESREGRLAAGKPSKAQITLEARNAGSEVWILVRDDGRGLNREKILLKAREKGLVNKADNELTDNEVYALIMLPGFSTQEKVTEFSGRGVGMDVVKKNIEGVGGAISLSSVPGKGTEVLIKIPLTLAIIDGIEIGVAQSRFTIPTTSIRESFQVSDDKVIADSDGNEIIMIRGQCYPVLRIGRLFGVKNARTDFDTGILVMVEGNGRAACLFADRLIGEQQVVVKALPRYIKHVPGIAGCTILGDGSISLILDVNTILSGQTG
jgi:two-component system chemotaxis sensor kinase CheA